MNIASPDIAQAAARPSERLDITIAKGMAIVLVVMSHILAWNRPPGNEWYVTLMGYVYLFHMPFFVFLSGYLHFKPGRLERISTNKDSYLKDQAVRLLLPFFFLGFVIVAGKLLLQSVVHVDNVPQDWAGGFINLIWHTKYSASTFLWYIYAIFIFCAVSLALFPLLKNRMGLWVALGLGLFMLPEIEYFYLNKLTLFFVFFCIGGFLMHHEEKYRALLENPVQMALLTIVFIASFLLFEYELIPYKYSILITGTLSLPVLHKLAFIILQFGAWLRDVFLFLGRKAYSIYLLNNICIGVTKAVIFMVMTWDGWHFFIVAPVLIASGLIGPIIAEWLILSRVPFIRQRILKS